MRIQPIQLGLPPQIGTSLFIKTLTFDTEATTCTLYYEVRSENGARLAEGNINLTELEYAGLSFNSNYIEDLTTSKLGLTKDTTVVEDETAPSGTTSGTTLTLSGKNPPIKEEDK